MDPHPMQCHHSQNLGRGETQRGETVKWVIKDPWSPETVTARREVWRVSLRRCSLPVTPARQRLWFRHRVGGTLSQQPLKRTLNEGVLARATAQWEHFRKHTEQPFRFSHLTGKFPVLMGHMKEPYNQPKPLRAPS